MSSIGSNPRSALIVDDEPAICALLDDILTDAGFSITCVDQGRAAIDVIDHQHFDLLVVDIGLPDISGLHVCAHAREKYGEGVAILIITADTRVDRLRTALDLGADDFIPKPFDNEELLTRIELKLRRAAAFASTPAHQIQTSTASDSNDAA